MTSREALELADVPERLLVIGGGYIGMELGTVYARLGSEVVLVEATDAILRGADRDLVAPVQAAAEEEGRAVQVATFPWQASGRARTLDRTDGLTKLVLEPDPERVLGVGIAGHSAVELIEEGVHAIEMGATAYDLAATIHPHPTLSETLNEAAWRAARNKGGE